jgi:manganese transport protein
MSPPPAEENALPCSAFNSLPEVHRSIALPVGSSGLRRAAAFFGPGYLVAVGYMDPGNWATGLAGGSAYGYSLLWVVMLANLMAMLLQVLSARLGIATGQDLAQACRAHGSRRSAIAQWLLCELAICACDLAEVIGMAVALELLFGIPLAVGVVLTALDTFVLLWLQQKGFRRLEAFVLALILTILACLAGTLLLSSPDVHAVLGGLLPRRSSVAELPALLIAVGILGATVMPHNLYLHSAVVQTRRHALTETGRREAIRYATIDTTTALTLALLVNAAILVTAASVFHTSGHRTVAELQDAYHLMTPLLGTTLGSLLFGVALLASGQSSTLTATLAGQVVMEGFVQWRLAPWKRRLLTRGVAMVPALAATLFWGDSGTSGLLIGSQIVLSLQLPFALVPLVRLTGDRRLMGPFVNGRAMQLAAWAIALVVVALNGLMLVKIGLSLLGAT